MLCVMEHGVLVDRPEITVLENEDRMCWIIHVKKSRTVFHFESIWLFLRINCLGLSSDASQSSGSFPFTPKTE